mgnify:CR=1 FL=1
MSIQKAENANWFQYHKPHGDQSLRYERIRAAGKVLADTMAECCPDSSELTVAIRRVREAVMFANAAIACNEGEA